MIASNNFLSTQNRRSLYEQDYAQWLEVMTALIRERNYEQLDWDNLLEELESMGKNEQRELESRLIVLLMHFAITVFLFVGASKCDRCLNTS